MSSRLSFPGHPIARARWVATAHHALAWRGGAGPTLAPGVELGSPRGARTLEKTARRHDAVDTISELRRTLSGVAFLWRGALVGEER